MDGRLLHEEADSLIKLDPTIWDKIQTQLLQTQFYRTLSIGYCLERLEIVIKLLQSDKESNNLN